jgi:hypothetical protein
MRLALLLLTAAVRQMSIVAAPCARQPHAAPGVLLYMLVKSSAPNSHLAALPLLSPPLAGVHERAASLLDGSPQRSAPAGFLQHPTL